MISHYMFQRNFNNADHLSKNKALSLNISNNDFATTDTDGDRKLSINEILNNQNICDTLMVHIDNAKETLKAEANEIKEKIHAKRKDKTDTKFGKDVQDFKQNMKFNANFSWIKNADEEGEKFFKFNA